MKRLLVALSILFLLGPALASDTFGTKVKAGDPDLGLPLSPFSPPPVGQTVPTPFGQISVGVSYWDIGSTPGAYDETDPIYLQFSSSFPPGGSPARIVREGNIRLAGWGPYTPGSKVKAGDSDIGQQLLPWGFGSVIGAPAGIFYMDVAGGPGYDLGDPVYLHLAGGLVTGSNDIRITPFAGFPAGSKVSLGDPDGNKPLVPLWQPFFPPGAGQALASDPKAPVARLAFFNANGNYNAVGLPIYDGDDPVYLSTAPPQNPGIIPAPTVPVVPNDVRLY